MPDWKKAHNIAIVLSAGRGSRMHTQTPKQYLELCGRPVIAWSLGVFEAFDTAHIRDEVFAVITFYRPPFLVREIWYSVYDNQSFHKKLNAERACAWSGIG